MRVVYGTVLTEAFTHAALALGRSLVRWPSTEEVLFFCLDEGAARILRELGPPRSTVVTFESFAPQVLSERRGSVVETFSGGMKRRLEIARGLLHSPRVLFLDEPTIGLDPQSRASVWEYVRTLKESEDITVFLTTHYMDEAENCDRIAIMSQGRIVALDTPDALKAAVGKDRVQITTADDEAAIASLRSAFGIEAGMHSGEVTFAVADGERFVPRLFAELGVPIRSVSVASPSLDDVFLSHTGRTISDAEAAERPIPPMLRAGRR